MSETIELLPQLPRYYKANLHTHSNVSDGAYTPQEVKRLYKEKGYDILAFTDHNVMAWHKELDDPDFLVLAGGEFNIDSSAERTYYGPFGKTYHLNFIATNPDIIWQPFDSYHRKETNTPWLNKAEIDSMPRVYDLNAVNAIIAKAVEHGYLVTYNHPVWSMQEKEDYAGLRGLWAMEVTNTASYVYGKDEDNSMIYHQLVRGGMPLFPVAADDMHSTRELAKSWCMVGAKELTYPAVTEALKNGDFYATTGPEIFRLAVSGSTLRVECSAVREIRVQTHVRLSRCAAAEADSTITCAEFDMPAWFENEKNAPGAFLRVTAIDTAGRYAMTRAYYMNELIK